MVVADALDSITVARDERDVGAAVEQTADQREPQTGRAAGNRDPQTLQRTIGHTASSGSRVFDTVQATS
jgi:hypothetical protein